MSLLFEHLEKVFANYEKAWAKLNELSEDDSLFEIIRSGYIQTFEYTWDAFVKAITRCLVEDLANSAAVDKMSYKQQMVEAQKKGYITDVETWLIYRKLRNKTSHDYGEHHANNIIEIGNEFQAAVKYGLEQMKARYQDPTL